MSNTRHFTGPLTNNSLRILAFVQAHGPVTNREIMQALSIRSANVLTTRMRRLIRLGLIKKEPGLARTIRASFQFIPADKLASHGEPEWPVPWSGDPGWSGEKLGPTPDTL